MYIKHVANNILLDYTYSTFKRLENNEYGLKTQAVFQLNKKKNDKFLFCKKKLLSKYIVF